MSIFKRGDKGGVQQKSTSPEKGAQGSEPVKQAAPGVVPPPAAPIYSTRLPDPSSHVDGDVWRALAEKLTAAGEAQLSAQPNGPAGVRAGLRFAVQRTRTASAPAADLRQGLASQPPPPAPSEAVFDPAAAAQAGLLNLAWRWQDAGAPIRAIHTYMELLARHPGTPAAAAAVADLVELSNKLVEQGNFHTALTIYDEMAELQQMSEEC